MPTHLLRASTVIACGVLLAACQTAQSPKAEGHLSQRWEGKPVAEFEKRFGKPASGSASGKLVWSVMRNDVTPAHERSFGIGVSGVAIGDPLKTKVEARTERKSCTIEVSASNGTITRIDIVKDDSTREAASLCLQSFG
ncbi:hypothetical protein ABID16_002107 [Rhizobium aquaticum]|uniref:Lipoprotein n=1 Tax=Rhizobium aquaticum TaxID=1549636 RepID=A0ABV2IZB1_9HYPH